jgi:hypothetical protein
MFLVEWLQTALDELADIWNRADSALRQAITAASHDLEQRLQNDAAHEGESRAGSERFVFVPPPGVTFRVEPDGQTVTVLHVRVYRPRKR